MQLRLGPHRLDLRHRALVLGVVSTSVDPSTAGTPAAVDACARAAEALVAAGADLVEVGAPGAALPEPDEVDRVVPAIAAIRRRVDVPLACGTGRASVARAAYAAGAVVGDDRSGFADPEYLPAAAEAGAAVVATAVLPGGRDPFDVDHLTGHLAGLARRADEAGVPPDRVLLDTGADLAPTWAQAVARLRASPALARLGHPLVASAPAATSAGGPGPEVGERLPAHAPAHALGVIGGCRIVRTRDVRAARRVVDVLAAVLAADAPLAGVAR